MPEKARLGKNEQDAIRLAAALNARYRIRCERRVRDECSASASGNIL
jgi:hypothetical protein